MCTSIHPSPDTALAHLHTLCAFIVQVHLPSKPCCPARGRSAASAETQCFHGNCGIRNCPGLAPGVANSSMCRLGKEIPWIPCWPKPSSIRLCLSNWSPRLPGFPTTPIFVPQTKKGLAARKPAGLECPIVLTRLPFLSLRWLWSDFPFALCMCCAQTTWSLMGGFLLPSVHALLLKTQGVPRASSTRHAGSCWPVHLPHHLMITLLARYMHQKSLLLS